MKRLLLLITALCLTIIALRYFFHNVESREAAIRHTEKVGSREGAIRDRREEIPAASTTPSGGQYPATESSSSSTQDDSQSTKPASSVWRAFMSWIGLSSRKGNETSPSTRRDTRTSAGVAAPGLPGNSSISGKVLDETGLPVPGMDLSAEPVGLFQNTQGASGKGPAAMARSDPEGVYRFEQLPEGEYRVRTDPTGLYLPAEILVRTGVDSANLVVTGEYELSIHGQVKDSQGKPLGGVRVVSVQTPPREVSTDQSGGYSLQIAVTLSNRDYTVKFQLAGYREETRQLDDSQIYSRKPVQLDATLSPVKSLAVVAGRVTRGGRPFAGVLVQLLGLGVNQGVTNQAGEFIMPEVEANHTYKFWIPAYEPYQPYSKQVEVGPDGLWQDVILERTQPETGPLSGRMMDTAGSPLPRFTLWLQSDNPLAGRFLVVTSDDAGRYAIDDVPLGRLTFTTQSSPRFIVSGINLPQGGAQNVDLILDWGSGEVSGRIVDPEGKPVPDSKVALVSSYKNGVVQSSSEREVSADADGIFRFAQLGPGIHSASVSAPGFRNTRLELDVPGNSGSVLVRLERN